jgi:hypothetical protein
MWPRQIELLSPSWIVFERKDPLDGFCATRSRLQECFDSTTEVAQSWVGVFAMSCRRPVYSVQDRSNFQELAASLEKIVVEHLDCIARVWHGSSTSPS